MNSLFWTEWMQFSLREKNKETKEADFETGDMAGKKATWVWC